MSYEKDRCENCKCDTKGCPSTDAIDVKEQQIENLYQRISNINIFLCHMFPNVFDRETYWNCDDWVADLTFKQEKKRKLSAAKAELEANGYTVVDPLK